MTRAEEMVMYGTMHRGRLIEFGDAVFCSATSMNDTQCINIRQTPALDAYVGVYRSHGFGTSIYECKCLKQIRSD